MGCPCFAFMQSNLNQDTEVDTQDLVFFLGEWMAGGYWSSGHFISSVADFNYDGIVNQEDFGILSQEWRQSEPNAPDDYSNQPVSVWAGGYGYAAVYGEPVLFPGKTYGFAADRFLAGGILRTFRLRLYTDNGAEPILGTAKLKILSGFSNPFTLKADVDITEAVNSAKQSVDENGRFTLEYDCLSHDLAVTDSDFLAFYFPEHICFVRATEAACPRNEQVLYNSGGDLTGATVILDRELNGYSYLMDFRIDSQDYIIFDRNDQVTTPACIDLPYYENEPQYIILEDVYVPYTKNLKIDLCHTLGDGSDEVLKTITVDNATAMRFIDFDGFASSVSCAYAGRYNLHIWTDPQQGRIDVLYYNKYLFNIQHISLTFRNPQRIRPGSCIRRLYIHQDFGTGSIIDRIVVCRKPVLAIGDSFVSGYTYETILGHVGKALSDNNIFSQRRYVINGGISGNRVLDSYPSTATQIRWNDANHDLCAYHDVIVALVNGPGLNDVAQITSSSTAEQITQKAQALAQAIAKMATEALSDGDEVGGRNSVILCEMIPYTYNMEINFQSYLNQKACQEQFHVLLSELAVQQNIPIARVYEDFPSSYSDGTHPTAIGSLWIAQRIANVYETHQLPSQ